MVWVCWMIKIDLVIINLLNFVDLFEFVDNLFVFGVDVVSKIVLLVLGCVLLCYVFGVIRIGNSFNKFLVIEECSW